MQSLEDYYGITTRVSVKITSLEDDVIGRCTVKGKKRTIYIDDKFFAKASPDNIEEVMLHEFGHCVFNQSHRGEYIPNGPMQGCMSSVMHSYIILSYSHCWTNFKTYYFEEIRPSNNMTGSSVPYERSDRIF
jgi:hypothetical protein